MIFRKIYIDYTDSKMYMLKHVKAKRRLNKSGFITFKTLIFLAFIFFVGYVGYKMLPPVFSNLMFKAGIGDELKTAYLFNDNALADRILKMSKIWGVPVTGENITIKRGDKDISVSVSYHVTVDFYDRYKWEHDYDIYVQKPLAAK